MIVLTNVDFGGSAVIENLVDATSLTLLATPIIYFWIARPFVMKAREAHLAVEQQLEASNRLLAEIEVLNTSLQRVSRENAESHERLLQKIGAELHDGPAQQLTYVLLQTNRLLPFAEVAREKGIKVDVEKVRDILQRTVQEVRSISTGLSLPELANASIDQVIALAVHHHEMLGGARVSMTCRDLPETCPMPLKVCIYRVVQEALTNARKHSTAKAISVTASGGRQFELAIVDNGAGFATEQTDRNGLGLNGMNARVHALGGHLEIRSGPGRGTSVVATFDAASWSP
jgi:signal transduction histidine kinase